MCQDVVSHNTDMRKDGAMLSCYLHQNSDPTIWMSKLKLNLTRPSKLFLSSVIHFWQVCTVLSLPFLNDRSCTCVIRFCSSSCIKCSRCVFGNDIRTIMSGHLSYFCFSICSNQSGHSPLNSGINKAFLANRTAALDGPETFKVQKRFKNLVRTFHRDVSGSAVMIRSSTQLLCAK